ncbi:deoxyribonuclease IV [Candidatus Kuenenbacteria bacterium]|nr:deoxyribonuclease IV [Candidatus Kuenenbacteria bacterium]
MQFGAHVSIAGGIENAPTNAQSSECEVFQMFSRSPRGGQPKFTDESIEQFKKNCQEFGFQEYYIHTPYYINLASSNNRIRYGSITAIRDELEVGTKIGAKYIMTHLGSSKDYTEEKALELVIQGIDKILAGYSGSTELLIENSAGSGNIIGDQFEEIGFILKKIKSNKVGICFDTCHAFASGYDLRDKAAINKTLKEFDKHIGLDKLKMLHINDSKTELGSFKDRHDDLGEGLIGKEAFNVLVNHPKLKNINGVIETPGLKISDTKSLKLLKKLRIK